MPVERRDILFTMTELAEILARAGGQHPGLIPGNIKTAPPVEAILIQDRGQSFVFQQKRLLGMMREPPRENGIVFRTLAADTGIEKAFFLPDKILVPIFIEETQRLKIMLSRSSEKAPLVDGIHVGIRMMLGSVSTLQLED